MYSLKCGASLHMTPEIEKILSVMHPVYRAYMIPIVITSGLDGPHRQDSLHYKFRAFDVRKFFPDVLMSKLWELHGREIIDAITIKFLQEGIPARILNEEDHLHAEYYGP